MLISEEDMVDAGVGESAWINFCEKNKIMMHMGRIEIGNTSG